jgi:arylsulfatase A-like enzyme
MTRHIPLLALGAAALLALAGRAHAQDLTERAFEARAEHVILISVDALRPDFYLDERWPAPMMQYMAREGSFAYLARGVTPTNTYPSHTTIVTGALPARHGIHHNRPFEPDGQTGAWKVEAERILVPTLWDAARAAGKTSAGISWPVSVGADIDWNIPEFWSVSGEENGLTGPAAHTAALRSAVTPGGMLEEIEAETLGPFPSYYWGRNRPRDAVVARMAGHIIERYRPNLFVIHLTQLDWHQHAYGREHDETRLAVSAVDRAIAELTEAAMRAGTLERTAFIVTGDHGFIDIDTQVAPNVWLVEAGLQEDRADRGDWRATFHPGGGSAFLMLRDPDDLEAVAEVRRILEDQPEGVRALYRIVEADELAARGADPASPLALATVPGVTVSGDTRGPAVRAGSGGSHGFFPEYPEIHTGFIAWGAGVAPGRRLPLIHLVDVAPFAAALLELPFVAPDGVLRPGLLRVP